MYSLSWFLDLDTLEVTKHKLLEVAFTPNNMIKMFTKKVKLQEVESFERNPSLKELLSDGNK